MGVETIVIFLPIYLISFVCFYALLRNNKVAAYQGKLIDKLYYASIADRLRGNDPAWRRKVYNSVSYNEMVLHFWKKLDDFYPDKKFIQIEGNLEADLRDKMKGAIESSLPKYMHKDNKINFDSAVEYIFALLIVYAPAIDDIKKED